MDQMLLQPITPPRVRVLSYGAGLDSFALLLAAVGRRDPPDLVIFADVADPEHLDPGEWPGTYRHIREVVQPLCAREHIEFVWLNSGMVPVRRQRRSLFAYFEARQIIPGRQSRLCTCAAKVDRIRHYLRERFSGRPIEMWLGFEAGEEERAAKDPHANKRDGMRTTRFPLIEWCLCRCRCQALVERLGYPVPRKSACVFCPFGSRGDFQTLARELPEQFARVEALEAGCRRTKAGHVMTFSKDGSSLRAWMAPPYRPRVIACGVCGAPQRATKKTGCSYLSDAGDGAGDKLVPLRLAP